MSEKEPIDASGDTRQFEVATRFIESSLFDPEIDRILDKAMLLDEYLRTYPTNPEKRSQIVAELDDAWKPWMKAPVKVTGEVRLYKNGQLTDPIFVDDLEGVSNGFNIVTFQSDDDAPDIDPFWRRSRVTHDLYLSSDGLGDDYDNETPHRGLAVVDKAIVQTDMPSSERAMMWLETSAPYFLEEVDRRITKMRSPEEALLALKGLQVDACIEVSDDLSRNSAEVYLNTMIQLDPEVPYDVHISGVTYQSTQSGMLFPIYRQLHAVGEIGKLNLTQGMHADGILRWELTAPTKLMLEDITTDKILCDTPINTVLAMRSLRKVAFARRDVA